MLVGTGTLRTWLALPDEDKGPNAKLYDLSNSIQQFVENQCSREFEAKLYKTDPRYCYFDGTGQPYIFLPQYPVWYVSEARVDADRDFTAGWNIGTNDLILYEEEGRLVSEVGYFTRGRRNVRLEYYAGYGTGTHWDHDGAGTIGFAIPYDLQQLIVEMVAQAFKEGITAVHTIEGGPEETKFTQMLSGSSAWRKTINNYKNLGAITAYGYDTP